MSAQLRSELLKIRTTRTIGAFLLAAVALTLLGVLVEGLSAELAELATEDFQRTLIGDYGASNAVLLSAFVGLLLVTSEFRYGTIRPTLLLEPRRRVFLAAKLAAAAFTGIVFGVVCVALSFGAGLGALAARDVDVALTGTNMVVLAVGPVAASALTAMLGVALGALVRNQVGAIVALAVYALAVEKPGLRGGPVGRPLHARTVRQCPRRHARREPARSRRGRRGTRRVDARLRHRGDRAHGSQRRLETPGLDSASDCREARRRRGASACSP